MFKEGWGIWNRKLEPVGLIPFTTYNLIKRADPEGSWEVVMYKQGTREL